MNQIPGVILAGGQARRMGGGDKCLLTLGQHSILSHVIKRLAPQVGDFAINANGDPARFVEFGVPVLADTIGGFVGPLGGILTAMEWAAKQGHEYVVTVAADTPFFPQNLVETLQKSQTSSEPFVLAATHDPERGIMRHPTFGLWPVRYCGDLADALKNEIRKVVQWTDRHGTAAAVFDTHHGDPFFNINTVADLGIAKRFVEKG